jgi:hypothetical protein
MSGGDFDEVHDSLMHCVCMYYNAMKKTLSRLKEALTRALNTIHATRDAANFLSSASNYFARREFSPRIFRRCTKALQNAAFLHARSTHDEADSMRSAARANVPRNAGIHSELPKNRCEKFFWISSRNPSAVDQIASGIARITPTSDSHPRRFMRPRRRSVRTKLRRDDTATRPCADDFAARTTADVATRDAMSPGRRAAHPCARDRASMRGERCVSSHRAKVVSRPGG